MKYTKTIVVLLLIAFTCGSCFTTHYKRKAHKPHYKDGYSQYY